MWMTPGGAIAAAVRGAILLPPPTWVTLRELEPFVSAGDVLDHARSRRVDRREPLLVEEDGVRMLVMPGDPVHPGNRIDAVRASVETRFVWSGEAWRPIVRDRRQ
jgi:hypothetical protein